MLVRIMENNEKKISEQKIETINKFHFFSTFFWRGGDLSKYFVWDLIFQ